MRGSGRAEDREAVEVLSSYKALLLELDAQLKWSAHDPAWRDYRHNWLANVHAVSVRSCAGKGIPLRSVIPPPCD